jgi:hypothetical protein
MRSSSALSFAAAAGAAFRELRSVSGCSVHLHGFPDVPRCVKKGEEVSFPSLLSSYFALLLET